MKKISLILLLITASCFTVLQAQQIQNYPDVIVQKNGDAISCRILNIDSAKIDIVIYTYEREVTSFVELNEISSYIYKGKQTVLSDSPGEVKQTDNESTGTDEGQAAEAVVDRRPQTTNNNADRYSGYNLPEWQLPYYKLHTDGQPSYVTRLSILAPGLMVEFQMDKYVTMVLRTWLGFYFESNTINGNTQFFFLLQPGIGISPRFYLNLDKRIYEGKRVDYYSGIYAGIPVMVQYDGFSSAVVQAGGVLGFQRTLGRKGYWNISLGPGIAAYNGGTVFGLIGELTIGVILSK
jgi:hypothetical protein